MSVAFLSVTLSSCSLNTGVEKVEDKSTKVESTSSKSPTMQIELTSEEQSKQDELLKSQSDEIKETLVPNAYADITVKPAITAGEVEVAKGSTALVVIKAQAAGKFELEGYFGKDFPEEEYLSIAIPMDKVGTFQASFTPSNGEKVVVATIIVK